MLGKIIMILSLVIACVAIVDQVFLHTGLEFLAIITAMATYLLGLGMYSIESKN